MQKILIIDDDTTFRTRVQSVLEAKGYQTLLAASGAEGVHLARLALV
jgi:CheY-like chemotaxis protein